MFLTDYDNRPGEIHERKVVESFERFFNKSKVEEWFGILRYQLPYQDNKGNKKGRYEPDVLIFEKEKGLTIIEVKGITINQIVDILPNGWVYRNHYEVEKSPYTQAENQLYYLANKLGEDPLLYRRFSFRAIVAFPNITFQEWCEKGFDKLMNIPPILFKDDFLSDKKLEKIYSFNLQKSGAPLDNYRWNRVKEIFNVGKFLGRENLISKDSSTMSNKFIFSKLYVIKTRSYWESVQQEITILLAEGTKVYILLQISVDDILTEKFKKYFEVMQLIIHSTSITDKNRLVEDTSVINAKGIENIKERVSKIFPLLNMNQYLLAHGSKDKHYIVTASAGTGKTHVMIDRVLYLIMAEGISPSKIDLITFTNESTDEMKQRLQEKLLMLFRLTNKTKFLILAEELKDIQISTIHKYGKNIISTFSHEFALGQDFKVTGFERNKKIIIEKLVNEYFEKEKKISDFKDVQYYELIDYIKYVWSEMDKKGFSMDKINRIDWGIANDNHSDVLNKLFAYIFERAESRLNDLKKETNSLNTDDLVKKLSFLENNNINIRNMDSDRYLFIDEFQDSDDSQIKFIAQLANKLNYKLCVVGDIKQSIYRFRGANSKAFDVLKQFLMPTPEVIEYTLNHNYRTSERLMDKFEKRFIEWSENQLLPYDVAKDRVIAVKQSQKVDAISKINYRDMEDKEKKIGELILKLVSENRLANRDKKRNIGVIVRTNNEAREVETICKKNSITLKVNLDGNFYQSEAVRHFKYVLEAFLFPNDASRVVRALQTPYFGYLVKANQLIPFKGNENQILQAIFDRIDVPFNDYVEQIKTVPLLTIFQKLMINNDFYYKLNSYYSIKNSSAEKIIQVEQYRRNLHKLHNKIISEFGMVGNNIYDIHSWLQVQFKTNKSENEPSLNDLEAEVEITTVHGAKGRQFDTVIMTHNERQFNNININKNILFSETDTDIVKAGWALEKDYSNSHYTKILKDDLIEISNEEMRLLYVALTRSKSQLYAFIKNYIKDETWGFYLNDL